MIYTDPVILKGKLNVGEVKGGYQVRVDGTNLIFDNGANVRESELILNAD